MTTTALEAVLLPLAVLKTRTRSVMCALPCASAATVEVAFPKAVTLPARVLRSNAAAAEYRVARRTGLRWAAEKGGGGGGLWFYAKPTAGLVAKAAMRVLDRARVHAEGNRFKLSGP